jgi:hypothetical protein
MSLSARTKSLVEKARREVEPTTDDLARVRARLSTSLAAESPAVAAVPLAFLKVVGAGVAAAAVALGAWQLSKTSRAPEPTVPVAATPVLAIPACPPVPECPSAVVVEAPQPKPLQCPAVARVKSDPTNSNDSRDLFNHTFSVAADPVGDRWALEVGLLSDARVALDEDRPLDALGHAERHERLFPQSAFTEERLAIQVIATCKAGRAEAAKPTFAKLLERDPETTYLPRVRSACGDFGQEPVETPTDE